jgi:Tfp pilus assembly protein PilN
MRKKISFVILGSSGAPAKQVCTSKTTIRLIGLALIAFFAAVGYIVYDYYNLRETTAHLQNREVYLSNQFEEIQNQRQQIQDFANEINSLKAKLVALSSFEKKIRIIANIEK